MFSIERIECGEKQGRRLKDPGAWELMPTETLMLIGEDLAHHITRVVKLIMAQRRILNPLLNL